MMARIGQLDRRITIQQPSNGAANGFNEDTVSFTDFITVWASRMDVSDRERMSADQVNSTLMTRFVIRSSSDSKTVNSQYRISFDGQIWNIIGVKETGDGRNRFIELTAAVGSD